MHNGGATRDVATWRMVIGGVYCVTLGLPAVFQFLGLKSFTFPFLQLFLVSELSPSFFLFICTTTPTSLRLPFSVCAAYFEGTLFVSFLCFLFFIICPQISDLFFFSFFFPICFAVVCFMGFQDLNPSPTFFS